MNALAVAEQHASALRAYRHNPAYQLQGMQEMIQKLSVKDVEIRPGFGQTDFGYTHPIVNPHNQTVVCTAAMTEVDLENVALEMRDDTAGDAADGESEPDMASEPRKPSGRGRQRINESAHAHIPCQRLWRDYLFVGSEASMAPLGQMAELTITDGTK